MNKIAYKIGLGLVIIGTLCVFIVKSPWWSVDTAQAVGDLTIDWGVPAGSPIFTVTNMFSGQSESRVVEVTNNAPMVRVVGVRGSKTNEAGALGDALQVIILHGSTPLYGNGSPTGAKTLTQFFADSTSANGVPLLELSSGGSATLTFTALFAPEAGNGFQASNVVFDITLGVSVGVPEACEQIVFTGLPIFGTSRGDSLRGTAGNDLIFALEGGDSVKGGAGDDCIVGGDGGDSLKGEGGADVLVGGAASDSAQGGDGNDVIFGGDGSDGLKGDGGNDTIFGEAGSDGLQGGSGNDELRGGLGSDTAQGQAGTDTCEAEVKQTCEI